MQDATTASDGSYLVRVAPGAEYYVIASAQGFIDQFWNQATDALDATSVLGPPAGETTGDIDFAMDSNGQEIDGFVIRLDSTNDEQDPPFANLTAYLYKFTGGLWKKVTSQSATSTDGVFNYFDFLSSGSLLSPGSYRLEFATPAGWQPISDYAESSSFDLGADPSEVVGPVCYVSVSHLLAGEERLVVAGIDIADTKTKCHGEPGPSGSSIRRPTTASWVTAASTTTPTATPTPTPTPTPTSAPVSSPSPSPTPAPSGSPGANLAWLFWLVGALVAAGVIALVVVILVRPRP
jgi:hypothetical protein